MSKSEKPLDLCEMRALAGLGYTLGPKIGSGTFAKVFLAERRANRGRQKLACKVINLETLPKQYREKFIPRELRILMNVSHPNIISMMSIQQIHQKVLVFMSFAENGDLLQYVQDYGSVDEDQARFWFLQIVSALNYLHGLNIAHRDLKCENILLSKRFNAKLADFGFARDCIDLYGQRQLSRTFCGSAAYTAPEIHLGQPYNPIISDIWSLGVVLYVLVSGRMPFNDDNLSLLLSRQMRKSWKFHKSTRKSLSREIKHLIRNILEPNCAKRLSIRSIMHHVWMLNVPPQSGEPCLS